MNLEDIEREVNAIIGDRSLEVDWPQWESGHQFRVYDFKEARTFMLTFDDRGGRYLIPGTTRIAVKISAEEGLAILRAYCEFLDAKVAMQEKIDAVLNVNR